MTSIIKEIEDGEKELIISNEIFVDHDYVEVIIKDERIRVLVDELLLAIGVFIKIRKLENNN